MVLFIFAEGTVLSYVFYWVAVMVCLVYLKYKEVSNSHKYLYDSLLTLSPGTYHNHGARIRRWSAQATSTRR